MELENLKKKINEDIINSKLRIDCIYYVLKDIYREVSDTYNTYLIQQERKLKAEQDKEEGETK